MPSFTRRTAPSATLCEECIQPDGHTAILLAVSKLKRKIPKASQLRIRRAQKCVERHWDYAHKDGWPTSYGFHTLFGRSRNKTRRYGICGRIVRETCFQIVLKCWYLAGIGSPNLHSTVNQLLGKISYKVESSMRFATGTSHQLHSSHIQLQTVLSRWELSNRLQTGIIPRRRFCKTIDGLKKKSTSGGVLCENLDHTRLCRFSWACKEQTAVCHSRHWCWNYVAWCRVTRGVAVQHWVCGIQSKIFLHPQAGGDSKPVHQTHIPKHYDPFRHWLFTSKRSIILLSMRTALFSSSKTAKL